MVLAIFTMCFEVGVRVIDLDVKVNDASNNDKHIIEWLLSCEDSFRIPKTFYLISCDSSS